MLWRENRTQAAPPIFRGSRICVYEFGTFDLIFMNFFNSKIDKSIHWILGVTYSNCEPLRQSDQTWNLIQLRIIRGFSFEDEDFFQGRNPREIRE